MLICMARTTLDLDERLAREAKKAAAERGITLTRLIEEALREALAPPVPASDFVLGWEPVHGDALPDVDIADRGALYDRMEDRG
jgi:hypothetical protein